MHTQEKRTELLLHIRLTWAVRANVFAEWLVCYVDACMWLPLFISYIEAFWCPIRASG